MSKAPQGFIQTVDQISEEQTPVDDGFLQRVGLDTITSEYKIYRDRDQADFEAHEMTLHLTGWGEDGREARQTIVDLMETFLQSKADFVAGKLTAGPGDLPHTEAVA